MTHPKSSNTERMPLKEFCNFVEAKPIFPSAQTENLIMQKIEAALYPSQWLVYCKFFFIEAITGAATLFICPQFGLGFGSHNKFLHTLHETLDPFTFYVICGLLFIVVGAALSGLLLSYNEIQSIKKSKYVYYLIYALVAYFIFFTLGTEILLISAIPWIIGAIMGNSFGFALTSQARFALRAIH